MQPERTHGPLESVRVIDCTAMFNGPIACMILGDQGADVIKVEPPGSGDVIRRFGITKGSLSSIFVSINRNKRSVVVDLRTGRGREIFAQLLAEADVLVQNFRPGVMARLGFAPESVLERFPRLVYASIYAFGPSGPMAQRPAFDSVIQAASGMAASQAGPDGNPRLVQQAICDKVSGLHAAQAISAALFARERSGRGRHVEVSMLDATVAFLWPDVMQNQTLLDPELASEAARSWPTALPARDGWVLISTVTDEQLQAACRALDLPDVAVDERFAKLEQRSGNLRLLGERFAAATQRFDLETLCARLAEADAPHSAVRTTEELVADPQIIANGLLREFEHPHVGSARVAGPVARFGTTVSELGRPAPALGEHTDEVLSELGFAAGEIVKLRRDAVVA